METKTETKMMEVDGLDDEDEDPFFRLKCTVDGKVIVTKKSILKGSDFLNAALSDDSQTTEVSIDHIESTVLAKVVDYLAYHKDVPPAKFRVPLPSSDLRAMAGPWDAAFCDVDVDTIFRLLLAANYLAIKALVELLCAKLATLVRNQSVEQMKATFKIRPFTKAEEIEIKRDFPTLLDSYSYSKP
eukprot:gb/GEZN01017292.1/.p1 GENE.gb/GEZN01017292.1/~~gb/GEZN01017292.1/.p1  ORF type:complete len:186 (-),score=40.81 gb/GEZN01017292.1/:181-738(-)